MIRFEVKVAGLSQIIGALKLLILLSQRHLRIVLSHLGTWVVGRQGTLLVYR